MARDEDSPETPGDGPGTGTKADGGSSGDRVLRAITDDGSFRVITADTTSTVRAALERQSAQGDTARHFADLVTGTVVIRETMSPQYRVQGVLKGAGGRGSLVADAHPDGTTRGLVQLPADVAEFRLGDGSVLQVMRRMANGKVYRGIVQAPPNGDVSTALMAYMQESEQVVSVVAVGAHWADGAPLRAGGYVVQLLPGAQRGPLMVMTERLENMASIEALLAAGEAAPDRLLAELLYGFPHAQLDDSEVRYGCRCDRQTVVAMLANLGREELQSIVDEQDVIEITCDYCNTDYRIGKQHLEGLLQPS
jgi:molecular chaperone Hsp33